MLRRTYSTVEHEALGVTNNNSATADLARIVGYDKTCRATSSQASICYEERRARHTVHPST